MASPDQASQQENGGQDTDYEALARFLMSPFLDKPEDLKFHVESLAGGKKLWLRAAFDEEEDKGRVFGRGGRNIRAIREAIMVAGRLDSKTVNLSVFGEPQPERSDRGGGERNGRGRGGSRSRGRKPRASTNPAPPRKKSKS